MMKENDLTVGDWVHRHYNSIYEGEVSYDFRVTQLTRHYGDELLVWGESTDGKHHGNLGSISQIEPIELTIEILEKNGFVKNNGNGKFCLSDDYFDIEIYEWSDSIWVFRYESCEMNIPHEQRTMGYLHELQHAFHDCGIETQIVL